MTKTCGTCGHPALDDQAQFCNRCGAAVPEEKKQSYPVCPGCGTVVSDELAQFCNRCGMKIPPVPLTCRTCGNPAIDSQSRFCTRCGTTFEQTPVSRHTVCPSCGAPDLQGQSIFCNRCGAPFRPPGGHAARPKGHAPVIVAQKRPAEPHPTLTVPDTDWEPWNDMPPAPAHPGTAAPPVAAPPAAPERYAQNDLQISVPRKRYAHLPLVADDMKKKADTAGSGMAEEIHVPPGKKRQGSQKKGVLGFLKK